MWWSRELESFVLGLQESLPNLVIESNPPPYTHTTKLSMSVETSVSLKSQYFHVDWLYLATLHVVIRAISLSGVLRMQFLRL